MDQVTHTIWKRWRTKKWEKWFKLKPAKRPAGSHQSMDDAEVELERKERLEKEREERKKVVSVLEELSPKNSELVNLLESYVNENSSLGFMVELSFEEYDGLQLQNLTKASYVEITPKKLRYKRIILKPAVIERLDYTKAFQLFSVDELAAAYDLIRGLGSSHEEKITEEKWQIALEQRSVEKKAAPWYRRHVRQRKKFFRRLLCAPA